MENLCAEINWTGDIYKDLTAFFKRHACEELTAHSYRAGAKAKRLAKRLNVDPLRAEIGGRLHDISQVIPLEHHLETAHKWGITVFPEEEQHPRLLHQKLSAVIAKDVFHVTDEGILSAIECHTTLKSGILPLDRVVFMADKLTQKNPAHSGCLDKMRSALYRLGSFDEAIRIYCDYLWEHRDSHFVPHRWFIDKSYINDQV